MTNRNSATAIKASRSEGAKQVTSMEARTVSIPLREPLAFATRRVDQRQYTLARIGTADGLQGYGFCYSGDRAGSQI